MAGWSSGSGRAGTTTEFAALGAPFDHRISRFEEAFTVVRTLLADGAIDFDGTYVQARDAELLPRPARAGGPLLLIGSSGPRMLAATAPYVDAWNAWYADTGNSPAGVAPLRATVDAAAVAAGREPAAIERTVAVQVRMPGGTGRIMGDTDPKQIVPPLEGPPEAIAERAASLRARGHRARPARRRPDHRGLGRRAGPGARGARSSVTAAHEMTRGRAPRRASRAIVRVLASAPTRAFRLPPCRGPAHATADPAALTPLVETAR